MKIVRFSGNIFRLEGESNIYILKNDLTIIDTGDVDDKEEIKKSLKSIVNPLKIKKVLFTHLHYDHAGNVDLFPTAKFYASKEEISNFKKDPEGTVLNAETAKALQKIKLLPFTKMKAFEIISTPGHTVGSVCFFYKAKKILFSGDTYFGNNIYGRTDLPSSKPSLFKSSIEKIKKIKYECLCSGHT